jgi:O-antigen/teichoic acid export membrane protein
VQVINLQDNNATEPQPSLTTRVVRGSLWSLSGQGIVLLVSFTATPFVIRLLGSEHYGVLSLINVLIGYFALAELGMGTASTRFGADAHARLDDRGEADVVWTSLLIAAIPALIGALTLLLAAEVIVARALQLPLHLRPAAVIALRLAAIGFVARAFAYIFNTPQLVRLRLDLTTSINTVTSVLQIALVPLVLLRGGGLVEAVSVIAGAGILSMLLHFGFSSKLLPALLRPGIETKLIKPLLRFGSALAVSNVSAVVLWSAEKVLLARSSVIALAHYTVAYSLAQILIQAPVALGQSLLPAFSGLQAESERPSLLRLYQNALRGNLLWMIPVASVACIMAQPFFTFWAGAEYGRESTLPFYILIVGLAFNIMAYIPYLLLIASGRTDLIARFHLLELVPYLICAALLTRWLGAVGAALAISLRMIVDALVFFLSVRRLLGFGFSPLPAHRFEYVLVVALLCGITFSAVLMSASLTVRGLLSIMAVMLYVYVVWTRVLTREERAWMSRKSLLSQ